MHRPNRPAASKYANFSTENFIYDEYFQEYVFHPTEEDILYWDSFVNKYPNKSQELEEAKVFLETIQFKRHELTDAQIGRIWEKINREIFSEKYPERANARSLRTVWWTAAAVVLVFIGTFALINYFRSDKHIYTASGEFRDVLLPDGSVITLSPNSELSFHHDFRGGNVREVWIKGGAFFSVKHLDHTKKYFIAHTQDLDIRVLGTTFNVNTRHQSTKVVLNTGKVEIQFRDKNLSGVYLNPGDMLTYSENDKAIKTDSVNTLPFISWKDRKFIFDNTSVEDIAREMEDYYGYKVLIKDKALAERKITGTLIIPNAPALIDVLSTLLNVSIEKKGDTLIIK